MRRFVYEENPAPPFKPPKKGDEVNPTLVHRINTGKEYMDLFAQPEK